MPDPIDQAHGGPGGAPATPPAPGGQSGDQPQPPGGAAPQFLEVGGVKYTPDQIQELAKAKTDYGQLQKEFTQRSQILSDPQKFREFGTKQFPDIFPQQPAGPVSDEEKQKQEAIATLRSLGFITKDEADQMGKKQAEDLVAQREADAFVRTEVERLSKEWDGANGKPKFDPKEVLPFAAEHGLLPEDAFRKLKWNDLLEYHAAQKAAGKPKAPVIATPGGGTSIPTAPDKQVDLNQHGAVAKAFLESVQDKE